MPSNVQLHDPKRPVYSLIGTDQSLLSNNFPMAVVRSAGISGAFANFFHVFTPATTSSMIAKAFLMFMSFAAKGSAGVMSSHLPLMLIWCCFNQIFFGSYAKFMT